MKLSIDYDDTYTKDPILWDLFAQNAITRGHTVYCVSLEKYIKYGTTKTNYWKNNRC